jgi:hypothetical protein
MKFTHGGIPETDAWHWDDRTEKILGQAIADLYSGSAESQRKGRIAFYELKRYFMLPEWNQYLFRLDQYRVGIGHKPVYMLLRCVGDAVIENPKFTEPINFKQSNRRNPIMKSLMMVLAAMMAMSEAMAAFAKELNEGATVAETVPVPEAVKEEPKVEPVQEKPAKKTKEEPKAEPAPEPVKEEKLDFVKLREECKTLVLDLVNAGKKETVVKVLAEFKSKKLTEVKDEDLPELHGKLVTVKG